MDEAKRPGSITFLAGTVLLVTAVGLFAGFVPVYPCIDCAIRRGLPKGEQKDIESQGLARDRPVLASALALMRLKTESPPCYDGRSIV